MQGEFVVHVGEHYFDAPFWQGCPSAVQVDPASDGFPASEVVPESVVWPASPVPASTCVPLSRPPPSGDAPLSGQEQVQTHFDTLKKGADVKLNEDALARVNPPAAPPSPAQTTTSPGGH